MYGYPKHVNTRADIEHLMGYLGSPWATPENKERGLSLLQGLIDSSKSYVFDRNLGATEQPDGPEPNYIVLEVPQDDGSVVRRQEKLVDDPNARIHRLGLTVAEVQSFIATVQGV